MDVCQACGLIAPTQRIACDACGATFSTPRAQAPSRTDDAYWVSVRCKFACRACGLTTPLNELDADGTVGCARCGIEQAFDVREWVAIAQHAHEVGDLAGPDPNGRKTTEGLVLGSGGKGSDNPFKTTGVKHGAASLGGPNQGRAEVLAGPGHPLCKKCHAPLAMPLDAVALKQCRATATCPTCAEATTFELPKNARAAYPALKAIVAEGNRADCKHVVFQPGAGGQAVVVRCPNCNADLPPLEPDARHVTCTYCKVAAFIPARAWARQGAVPPEPQMWWMLFRGPSPRRLTLETLARKALAREEGKKNDEAHRARVAAERAGEAERKEAARVAEEAEQARVDAEQAAPSPAETKRRSLQAVFFVLLIAGFLGVVLIIALGGDRVTSGPRECTRGERRPCYDGPAETRGRGECRDGAQQCEQRDGAWRWSVCTGAKRPASGDKCKNLLDDNCNGQVDEGCPSVLR